MNAEYWIIAIVTISVISFLIGRHLGQNPAEEKGIEAKAEAVLARIRAAGAAEIASLQHKAPTWASSSTPAPPSAPAAVPAPAWTLGDSYSSLGALAADIKRPDFTREVGVDGVPVFNIGGGNPVQFYTVGGALTQTTP